MPLSYISDYAGNTIAVQIPIEDWNLLKKKYPDVEAIQEDLPQWQKELIDKRLEAITANPGLLRPIEELYKELDNNED